MPRSLIAALFVALALAAGQPARAFDTIAKAAYVVDVTTGTVLLSKDADTMMPPASMSKLMTLDILFSALKSGRVKMTDTFPVSKEATRLTHLGGSTMYLKEGDHPTVRQLIQGIIVNSGNDACVTVAEGLAGTEDAFAQLMNREAKQLGLKHSEFANASGWPNPHQLMSMHDLAKLAIHIIKTYPEYYHFFGEQEFDYDNRAPGNRFNRNPLLGLGIGADGMKTGHTEASGYGLVGSAKRGDRRVLVVLNGLPTENSRGTEGEKLINWAFGQFTIKKVLSKGQTVAEANVWMGSASKVALVPAQDTQLLVPALGARKLDATVVYQGPLKAPIKAGERVATLKIKAPGMEERDIPLVAGASVAPAGFGKRLLTAAQHLLTLAVGKAANL